MKLMNNKYSKNIKNLVLSSFILIMSGIIVLIGVTLAASDSTILKNQVVDNLSFENASLEYMNNTSTFKVEVTNNNTDIYNLKYIEIIFKDENAISTKLIGYIGESIEVGETREIVASIDKDITNSVSLEYAIIK